MSLGEKNPPSLKNSVLKIESYIATIEEYVLTTGLIVMIFMGALQVILRNLFNTGIGWADVFTRSLVLWVGFMGASLATRRSKHINIDIVSKLITNRKLSSVRRRTVNIISLIIVSIFFKASVDFLIFEAEIGMKAFLGVPTWVVFIIVPISFFLITLRLLIQSITNTDIEEDT